MSLPNGMQPRSSLRLVLLEQKKQYTYTLRHSDPSGSGITADPMHFGVVRNNIYQVKVEGVEGKSKGIKLTIHVVPWAHYDHGEVIY